jgi:hypothetical protein
VIPRLQRWVWREDAQAQTRSKFRVLGKQARKIPPRPSRRDVRVRGRVPSNQGPSLHFSGEQMLADLRSCVQFDFSSGKTPVLRSS